MARRTAMERMQRILAILPWLVEHQGVPIDEVSTRFGVSRDELVEDLEFVFYNVGLHPFTPDMLAEVTFDDDRIQVHIGDYFRRPLRLTHQEALTLLAAGRALADRPELDPDHALRRALTKLSDVLGEGAEGALEVELGRADPAILATVRAALDQHRVLELDYYSHARDAVGQRRVEPLRLVSREGSWYLLAHCHAAGGERLFRLDRIRTAELTTDTFAAPVVERSAEWDLSSTPRTVEIVAGAEAEWVVRTFPCDEVERLDDGRLRIVLPVTATAWLERLLLRLGPGVEVHDLASGEDLSPIAAAAANRILATYRHP